MAVADQCLTERYALYNGDAIEVMQSLPAKSIHMSVYSPPFCGLFQYSSSERDLSNCRSYEEFFEHYEYVVREIYRVTMPGRLTAVHCMDVPKDGANYCGSIDFPGDIIRLHQKLGFEYLPRICIWKEPLGVRNRTMSKALAHKTIVDDSTLTTVACADYLLPFRKRGENKIPVTHPVGLSEYYGSREVPSELWKYKNWQGKQTENRLSHWIWRQYASAFWDDVRLDHVLPFKEARDVEDEKHLHPLQLDVIARCVALWSNPGETTITPFMGVGSEVYQPVRMGRRAIGIELKPTYFRQAVRNCEDAEKQTPVQRTLLDLIDTVGIVHTTEVEVA